MTYTVVCCDENGNKKHLATTEPGMHRALCGRKIRYTWAAGFPHDEQKQFSAQRDCQQCRVVQDRLATNETILNGNGNVVEPMGVINA